MSEAAITIILDESEEIIEERSPSDPLHQAAKDSKEIGEHYQGEGDKVSIGTSALLSDLATALTQRNLSAVLAGNAALAGYPE